MNICDMWRMQITHLLACKLAARLSAAIVVSTCRRCCWRAWRLSAGNWVNGNPWFSLSVDDLSALTSNSTKPKSFTLPSYIGNTYLISSSCFCFLTRRTGALGMFVDICIHGLVLDFRQSRSNSMAVLIKIFIRPYTSCNDMFNWTFTDS